MQDKENTIVQKHVTDCLIHLVPTPAIMPLEPFPSNRYQTSDIVLQSSHILLSHMYSLIHSQISDFILDNILIQVRLRTEVPSTPSSTQPGFKLMTSKS